MVPKAIPWLLDRLRRSPLLREGAEQTDGQLLEAFVERRDAGALDALVRRHAPMVWGVCCRTLANHHEAEDTFQATFLVLVRRAASIRSRELLANWLHGVAHKTACKARQMAGKRSIREPQMPTMPEPEAEESRDWGCGPEQRQMLDEELSRLPEKYQAVIVLCDLEGQTRTEAARKLRVPEGTVGSRLARARALLARRLTRRGMGLSATSVAAVWSEQASGAVTEALLTRTIKAVCLMAAGQTMTAGLLSTNVPALTDAVLRALPAPKWKAAAVVLLLAGLALGGGMVAYHPPASQPDLPEQPAQLASQPDKPEQPIDRPRVSRVDPHPVKDRDPKKDATEAGAIDFAKRYLREHPALPEEVRGESQIGGGGISRCWPSRAFEVRFDKETQLWTVTGSCRIDDDTEGVWMGRDGAPRGLIRGPGKSWEGDWKLVLSYNSLTRGYEVQKAEGPHFYKRLASMDDYGKWLQGRFAKLGRSADPVTTLHLVLDAPDRRKLGLQPEYSYGKDKIAVEPSPRGVRVRIGAPAVDGQAEGWTLLFEASKSHSLKVGEYGGAWCGMEFDIGPLIRIDYSPDLGKQACIWAPDFSWAGEFVVREIELKDKKVVRLAIDFITDTDYGFPATDKRDSRHILRGSLRFNSRFEPSVPRLDADAAE